MYSDLGAELLAWNSIPYATPPVGELRGTVYIDLGAELLAWNSIPYATPPVGELRYSVH